MNGIELFLHSSYIFIITGIIGILFFKNFKSTNLSRYFYLIFGIIAAISVYLVALRITSLPYVLVTPLNVFASLVFESALISAGGFIAISFAYFYASKKHWSFIISEAVLPLFIGLSIFNVFQADERFGRMIWIVITVVSLIAHAIYSTYLSRIFKNINNFVTIPYVIIAITQLFIALFIDVVEENSIYFIGVLLALNIASFLLFVAFTFYIVNRKENDVLLDIDKKKVRSHIDSFLKSESKITLADFDENEEVELDILELVIEELLEEGYLANDESNDDIYIKVIA